jgi:hypothetical protein
MNKFAVRALHFLLFAISLAAFAAVAKAQSFLSFNDTNGRKVVFTNFGTIVHPNQNLVSRGYEVVYNDGSGLKRVWYLNSANNSGIVPISLSADQPNGHTLSAGQAVYIRARMKTADNKLEIVCRYILKDGSPGIEAIVTVENNSTSLIELRELSIFNPPSPECQCPCRPVREFDGATVHSSIITIAPNVRYRKTTADFTGLPPLSRNESRDIPGCDPRADVPFG